MFPIQNNFSARKKKTITKKLKMIMRMENEKGEGLI